MRGSFSVQKRNSSGSALGQVSMEPGASNYTNYADIVELPCLAAFMVVKLTSQLESLHSTGLQWANTLERCVSHRSNLIMQT